MQQKEWEEEYARRSLVTLGSEASKDVRDFAKWLRRKQGVDLSRAKVLDAGCGAGKNSLYFAREHEASVCGFDIARNALDEARKRAKDAGIAVEYREADMGAKLPYADGQFDIVLDHISSNSLDEDARALFLSEVARVLKPGGYLYVRALALDGDKHAKELLKIRPGREHHTYVLPGLGITERVFTEAEFSDMYRTFDVRYISRDAQYAQVDGVTYKRQYWVAYLQRV